MDSSQETGLVDSQESNISVLNESQISSDESSSESEAEMDEEMTWGTDFTNINVTDFDDRFCGPSQDLGRNAGPLEYFSLFYDADFVSLIVTETNRYL